MNTTEIIIIALVITLVVLAGIWAYGRRMRTERLRGRFGPEYARAVEERGDAGRAERDLQEREKRVERFDLKPLSPEDWRRFQQDWNRIQGLFVDDPQDATTQADDTLNKLMSARGYPEGSFEQRLEDLSVEHAEAVQGHREAHAVVLKRDEGDAGTEDMRQAMLNYRRLFEDLAGKPEAPAAGEPGNDEHGTRDLRAAS